MEEETIYDYYAALALAVVYGAARDLMSKNPARGCPRLVKMAGILSL